MPTATTAESLSVLAAWEQIEAGLATAHGLLDEVNMRPGEATMNEPRSAAILDISRRCMGDLHDLNERLGVLRNLIGGRL